MSLLSSNLQRLLPRGRVLNSPAQLAGYASDALGYKSYRPDAVVIPADVEEFVGFMKGSRDRKSVV